MPPVRCYRKKIAWQIKAFLQRTADAELCETGTPEQPGKQNLPGAEEGDGFFYAKLIKK